MQWKLFDIVISLLIFIILFLVYVIILPIIPTSVNLHLLITAATYFVVISYLYKKYYVGLFEKPVCVKSIIVGILILTILYVPYLRWLSNNTPKLINTLLNQNAVNRIAYLFLYCVVIPVEEEVLFRGLYYRILKNRYNIAVAAVVSVALFTLIHAFQGVNLLSMAIQGLVYTYVYEKTQSVYASSFVHVLDNSLWFLVTYLYLN